MTICQQLATQFPDLADHFNERERLGMERYGAPLDPVADGRDWRQEAREELLDAMVYLTAQLDRSRDVDDYAETKGLRDRAAAIVRRIK